MIVLFLDGLFAWWSSTTSYSSVSEISMSAMESSLLMSERPRPSMSVMESSMSTSERSISSMSVMESSISNNEQTSYQLMSTMESSMKGGCLQHIIIYLHDLFSFEQKCFPRKFEES